MCGNEKATTTMTSKPGDGLNEPPNRVGALVRADVQHNDQLGRALLVRDRTLDPFDEDGPYFIVLNGDGDVYAWGDLVAPELVYEGPAPAKPEEPTSALAVVRATADGDRELFVRIDTDFIPWRGFETGDYQNWDSFSDVEILFPGVPA